MMNDLISRQAAIDAIQQHRVNVLGGYEYDESVAFVYAAAHNHIIDVVKRLPSAQQDCTECPDYDHETHSCPKYCEVIRETVEEVKERTGRWVFDENDFLTKCSECGCHPWFGVIPTPKEATIKLPHCPMCLVKMEGENESD